MRSLIRPLCLIVLLLLVPVLPFLLLGPGFESSIETWFDEHLSPAQTSGLVIGVLATDVFLPIPSSFVSTAAGMRLGMLSATVASWLGMTLGATGGYMVARYAGRGIAAKLAGPQSYEQMEQLASRLGPHVLVLTRAVPIFAEASVLLTGATGMRWWRFFAAVAASNLGIALAYSWFGAYARGQNAEVVALGASIALPVAAALVARRLLPRAAAQS